MTQMGILFGCFDIILGKDGQYYFIECNAPGYFLFLDPVGRYDLAKSFAQYLRILSMSSI
jgi:glutathione synthase/RimK-type ligase-like ATP-grasp enzyme